MIGAGIGVGVVGLGGMGRLHADNLRSLGADVVAGADIAAEQRERFAEEYGATVYADHEDLVRDDAVDAVVIATPNRFHEPIAVAALDAGRHVLVEKPLAHTIESAERIAAAAEESTASCMVGFHNRHAASAELFRTQHERGRFGDLTHVEANYVRRRGVPGPGTWFTNVDLAGGGALIDIGVHALDLALYAMDFPAVEEVSGVVRNTFGERGEYADPDGFGGAWSGDADPYGVEDSASAFVRLAGGRTIVLETAWASNRDPSMEFLVRGTEGGARFAIGDTDLTILEAATDGVDHYADISLTGDASVTGYREQDERFLESVAADAPPTTNTVEQALAVQRVVEAIYRSSEEGRAVSLDEVADAERATARVR